MLFVVFCRSLIRFIGRSLQEAQRNEFRSTWNAMDGKHMTRFLLEAQRNEFRSTWNAACVDTNPQRKQGA